MIIHHNLKLSSPVAKSVLTMGSFDGVHLGHRKILETVVQKSALMKADSVLVTFDQHPRKILMKDSEAPGLLTTPDERRDIFSKIGIDHLLCLEFNKELASMEALDFVRKVFVDQLHAIYIVTGYGHRFGKGGLGNHKLLEEIAPKYGFSTELIPMQEVEQNMISSTTIRNLLAVGDVDEAKRYLGYSYQLNGIVVHGNKNGKILGFPTANIQPLHPEKIIPAGGVYAIRARVADKCYNGMMNIGTRPTFNISELTIEAHLFGLDDDIYGETITVVFEYRIRDEQRFGSMEDLKRQLLTDKATSLDLLNITE